MTPAQSSCHIDQCDITDCSASGQEKGSTYPAGVRWVPSASVPQVRSSSDEKPLVACCASVSSAASADGRSAAAVPGA